MSAVMQTSCWTPEFISGERKEVLEKKWREKNSNDKIEVQGVVVMVCLGCELPLVEGMQPCNVT